MLFNNRVGAKKMVVFFCFGASLWTEPQWLGPYHKPAQKKKEKNKTNIVQYEWTSYSSIKCLLMTLFYLLLYWCISVIHSGKPADERLAFIYVSHVAFVNNWNSPSPHTKKISMEQKIIYFVQWLEKGIVSSLS